MPTEVLHPWVVARSQCRAKLIADLPIQLGAPVIFEEAVGSYVLTEQPDQTTLLKKSAPISRQNVITGRLLVQASF